MDRIIDLVNDLIALEQERDKEWKKLMIALHRGEEAVGDSAMLTHLRSLKELCLLEDRRLSNILNNERTEVILTKRL
jgi:hypothetical protein